MPWHFVDSPDMVLRTELLLLILFGDWVAVIVTSGPDQGATLLAGGGRNIVENMGVNRALTCAQTKRKFQFKNTVDYRSTAVAKPALLA